MIPYTGKRCNQEIQTRNSATDIVNNLTVDLRGSGDNITIDHFYTGVELVEDMYNNPNLMVAGTIQKQTNRQTKTGDSLQRNLSP